MLVFLSINNVELEYDDNELIKLIWSLASGESDYTVVLKWLQQHII